MNSSGKKKKSKNDFSWGPVFLALGIFAVRKKTKKTTDCINLLCIECQGPRQHRQQRNRGRPHARPGEVRWGLAGSDRFGRAIIRGRCLR